MSEHDAERGLLAGIIEGAYPGQVNGWYLADLILEAGFRRVESRLLDDDREGDDR